MPGRADLPTAVIVGLEANGLGVARALAAHGVPCIALAGPFRTPACRTNACEVAYSTAWTPEGLLADLKTIGERLGRKAPLLITKDEPVLWVSQFRDELSDLYEINLPDPDVVDLLMNKHRFLDLARSEGWPVPATWPVNSREELQQVAEETTYPCILKPRVKNSEFRKHTPQKAFKARDETELVSAYVLVAPWEKEVVVQEWIEGGDDRVAFCLSYCDRDGQPLAMFAGRKLHQWPLEWGNTALSEPAPAQWAGPVVQLTADIWRKVAYRGLGSVEFKMRPDGRPVIMEPTVGRSDYQNEVAVINGHNLPAVAYCDLAGVSAFAESEPSRPSKLVDGSAEWKILIARLRGRASSSRGWLSELAGRRKYMIWRAADPLPFQASVATALRHLLGRCARAVLGETLARKLITATRLLKTPLRFVRHTASKVVKLERYIVYACDPAETDPPDPMLGVSFRKLTDEDLLALQPQSDEAREVLAVHLRRGQRLGFNDAYGAFVGEELGHIGWLITQEHDRRCPVRNLKLGDGEAEARHCVTLPKFHSMGLYAFGIRSLCALAKQQGIRRLFIYTNVNNSQSQAGIAKAGMARQGPLVRLVFPFLGDAVWVLWRGHRRRGKGAKGQRGRGAESEEENTREKQESSL